MTIATQTNGKQWVVSSDSTPGQLHVVKFINSNWSCSCDGAFYRGHCRHITQVAAREAQPYTSRVSPEARAWAMAALTGKGSPA